MHTVKRATVTLTPAQILALFTTPVTVVPAPGVGKMIQVVGILYSLTYGTKTYAFPSGAAGLYYGSAAGVLMDGHNAFVAIKQSASGVYQSPPSNLGGFGGASPASLDNQPLVIAATAVNPTTGDGTLRVTVAYTVTTL